MSAVGDGVKVAGMFFVFLVYLAFAMACLALPVAACWYLFTH